MLNYKFVLCLFFFYIFLLNNKTFYKITTFQRSRENDKKMTYFHIRFQWENVSAVFIKKITLIWKSIIKLMWIYFVCDGCKQNNFAFLEIYKRIWCHLLCFNKRTGQSTFCEFTTTLVKMWGNCFSFLILRHSFANWCLFIYWFLENKWLNFIVIFQKSP